MARRFWHWLECRVLGLHDWTCAAAEGVGPREIPEVSALLDSGSAVTAFRVYARAWCRRCGRELR